MSWMWFIFHSPSPSGLLQQNKRHTWNNTETETHLDLFVSYPERTPSKQAFGMATDLIIFEQWALNNEPWRQIHQDINWNGLSIIHRSRL